MNQENDWQAYDLFPELGELAPTAGDNAPSFVNLETIWPTINDFQLADLDAWSPVAAPNNTPSTSPPNVAQQPGASFSETEAPNDVEGGDEAIGTENREAEAPKKRRKRNASTTSTTSTREVGQGEFV